MMKLFDFLLTVILLVPLSGCEEKTASPDTKEQANAVQAKQLSPEEKLKKLQSQAEAGDAQAQVSLGWMYANGEGAPKDVTKAVEWYQKAAKQGDAKAQFLLGIKYYNGESVPKDLAKAVEWLQKSAEQGRADAQFFLGWMYANGEGVSKDATKAAEWLQKSAEQGYDDAQLSLARVYYKGDGVSKNVAKAFEWYLKAAEQGVVDAQLSLGAMYYNGESVPKDAAKAFEWYLKAAEQGDANAQGSIGAMYIKGKGVPKDLVKAYAWFNLAAAQGDTYGKQFRDFLENTITDSDRTEGQRLATNWRKGDSLLASNDNLSSANSPKTNPDESINPREPIKQGTGTAFFVSSDGHLLTNQHVIKGCTEIKVAGLEDGAKVITSDSVNDIALLQLPGKSQDIAKLNPDPGKLRQGEDVIVFGYPLNSVLSSGGNLTPGTVSALTGLGNNTNQIQITAPIQPGSSGSPVMDKKGNVVAVVSMKLDDGKMADATGQIAQNVNFAINGQTVKAFLDANKVPYKTGGGFLSFEKSNADIAEEARKWTVLVECWK